MNKSRSVVFIVQGEGRGHMTQSIAMKRILSENDFELKCVLIGTSSQRQIPEFIRQRLSVPIIEFKSPNFITDQNKKGLLLATSIWKNLLLMPVFIENLKIIDNQIQSYQPDLIINFYEPLFGLYQRFYPKKAKVICVAHQYLSLHSKFEMPKGRIIEKTALQVFSRLTAFKADLMFGLSFYEMKDEISKRIVVVPPLLRAEVQSLIKSDGDYLLIYLLNQGYKIEVEEWHQKHKDIKIHCFTDDPNIDGEQKVDATLSYHSLDGAKFLQMMAGSKALVSTAGFESICEAMYMGKPALMVPVQGHYEQFVNSRDAAKSGAGVYADRFDIDKLMNHLETSNQDKSLFQLWANRSSEIISKHLKVLFNA